MRKLKDKLNTNIIIFLAIIFGLTFLSICNPIKVFSENENRYLTQKPKFTWKDLKDGKYTLNYEKFIIDQFVFRDDWITIKTFSERLALKQDIKSIYLGKDGYLFEKHDLSSIEEETARRNIERLIQFLEKNNEKYNINLMMIPTASEILKDKMPPFASGYNQIAVINEIKDRMKDKDIVIDVTDELRKHQEEYIYYRTDHHWTSLGAYYAYVQWALLKGEKPLSQDEFKIILASDKFYGTLHSKLNIKIEPDSIYLYERKIDMGYEHIADGQKKNNSLYDMSKLEIKDKYSVFLGGNHAIDEIHTNNKNGKSLLVIKDSYAHSIIPFLANHYETIYMIDLRYMNINVSELLKQYEITDILVLYNVVNYINDKNTIHLR